MTMRCINHDEDKNDYGDDDNDDDNDYDNAENKRGDIVLAI